METTSGRGAMRILIMGRAGFFGRHLCETLVEQGHQVVSGIIFGLAGPELKKALPLLMSVDVRGFLAGHGRNEVEERHATS